MLLQIWEGLLKAPNQVRGQALHSLGGNGRQSEVCPEMATWLGGAW